MATTSTTPADPVKLVQQLDPEAIRNRLDTIDRERQALLVLLRAAQRASAPTTKKAATRARSKVQT